MNTRLRYIVEIGNTNVTVDGFDVEDAIRQALVHMSLPAVDQMVYAKVWSVLPEPQTVPIRARLEIL